MTENEILSKTAELIQALPEKKPLVHVIPNGVSAAFCADVMAAAGARPVMADCALETGEITGHASAFVANLGQPSPEKEAAVRASLICAADNQSPAVFDPVGAGASAYRLQMTEALLSLPWKGIIKGNASEIHTILTRSLTYQGVDSIGFSGDEISAEIFSLQMFSGRILAVTGKNDHILDAGREAFLVHRDFHPYAVVGTGCAAGCLCGCFSALTDDGFLAALSALSLFGYAQSKIGAAIGYGSFKLLLLDTLSHPDMDGFCRYLKTILTYKQEK